MHRTQVLLEEQQYSILHNRAQREGKSLGALIRELLDVGLRASQRAEGKPGQVLSSLKGLIDDPDFDAREHDRVVYDRE